MKRKTVWQEIGERIEEVCEASGKHPSEIAEEGGFSEEALRLWKKGEVFPNQRNWEGLARAVGVSVRDLLTFQKTQVRKRA